MTISLPSKKRFSRIFWLKVAGIYLLLDGFLYLAMLLGLLLVSGCATTGSKVPPPAPEAVKVLVPIAKPCAVKQVPHKPRPVDDPKVLDLGFVDTIKAVVTSWLIAEQETAERGAANDKPCGDTE